MPSTLNFIILSLILILTGCSRSQHAVPIDLPCDAIENAVQDTDSESLLDIGEKMIPPDWWTLFNDPQLDEFIQNTVVKNPNLQTAQTKIFSAAYNAARIRSTLYPYIYWGADVSRQKLSTTGVIPFNSGPTTNTPVISVPNAGTGLIPEYFTLYETEVSLRYSFDFWNKNRNAFRAALGLLKANIAEAAFVKLELSIAVAQTYYQLQVNYKRKEFAQAFLNNRQQLFDLVQRRVNSNVDNEISLQFAESNLVDAKNLLLQIEGEIALNENQLRAYMAGNFEEEIIPINPIQQPLPKVPVPENLPLHLISQRPDIKAQIWMIRSAGRQIQVAKAGFYPDFNIAAFFGFQTIHFRELFKWPSTFFNVDPAVTLPIFDGGKLIADLRSSEINYDLAILNYNQSIIDAAKEVLDTLSILRISNQRMQEYILKLKNQQELYRLTDLRVSHNLSSFIDQLTSEANVIEAQDQEVVAIGTNIQAILGLIKALGGGYLNCEG